MNEIKHYGTQGMSWGNWLSRSAKYAHGLIKKTIGGKSEGYSKKKSKKLSSKQSYAKKKGDAQVKKQLSSSERKEMIKEYGFDYNKKEFPTKEDLKKMTSEQKRNWKEMDNDIDGWSPARKKYSGMGNPNLSWDEIEKRSNEYKKLVESGKLSNKMNNEDWKKPGFGPDATKTPDTKSTSSKKTEPVNKTSVTNSKNPNKTSKVSDSEIWKDIARATESGEIPVKNGKSTLADINAYTMKKYNAYVTAPSNSPANNVMKKTGNKTTINASDSEIWKDIAKAVESGVIPSPGNKSSLKDINEYAMKKYGVYVVPGK